MHNIWKTKKKISKIQLTAVQYDYQISIHPGYTHEQYHGRGQGKKRKEKKKRVKIEEKEYY